MSGTTDDGAGADEVSASIAAATLDTVASTSSPDGDTPGPEEPARRAEADVLGSKLGDLGKVGKIVLATIAPVSYLVGAILTGGMAKGLGVPPSALAIEIRASVTLTVLLFLLLATTMLLGFATGVSLVLNGEQVALIMFAADPPPPSADAKPTVAMSPSKRRVIALAWLVGGTAVLSIPMSLRWHAGLALIIGIAVLASVAGALVAMWIRSFIVQVASAVEATSDEASVQALQERPDVVAARQSQEWNERHPTAVRTLMVGLAFLTALVLIVPIGLLVHQFGRSVGEDLRTGEIHDVPLLVRTVLKPGRYEIEDAGASALNGRCLVVIGDSSHPVVIVDGRSEQLSDAVTLISPCT